MIRTIRGEQEGTFICPFCEILIEDEELKDLELSDDDVVVCDKCGDVLMQMFEDE